MATNPDFRDLFAAFNDAGVEYIVVGAHAVMVYTEPRYTKDLDIWVRPEHANSERVLTALTAFGAPLTDVRADDFAVEGTVFQIGVPPNRIDVITSVDGLVFEQVYSRTQRAAYGDVPIRILGRDDLLRNKRTVGRPQDLIDVDRLERSRKR
jgi:hypothetical protein